MTKEGESDMEWCLKEIEDESFEWKEWMREDRGEGCGVREEFSCRKMK